MTIGGTTVAAGVIGAPIRHSLSPAIFNGAFAAVGLDWAYLAFEVAEGEAPTAVAGARALGLAGLSVTMPHKAAVLPVLDELTDDARALGAVNCITRAGRRLVGANTDGPGLVDALQLDEGVELAGRRCAVVGAGGAGRAVARALAGAGAAEVVVVNRTEARAEAAAALAGAVGRAGPVEAVADADVVVNATSVGMAGATPGVPVAEGLLGAGQVVVDLVYHPARTALLAAAEAAGAQAVNGLGMLVHQAAHQFRAWTGTPAPVAAMRAAALAALAERAP